MGSVGHAQISSGHIFSLGGQSKHEVATASMIKEE
jgi:hypothetical protein